MTTKQELANDPDIIALSAMNDVTFRLLSPFLRNVVEISRKLVAEYPASKQ
jgi:hypothetical protein